MSVTIPSTPVVPSENSGYSRVHKLTAWRIAEEWGRSADQPRISPVSAPVLRYKNGPYSREMYFAFGELVIDYLERHPEHRFPEREAPPASAVGGDHAAVCEALEKLGWPQIVYRTDLQEAMPARALKWFTGAGARREGAAILWLLGYERNPNPNEKQGRWLYKGRQTSRYQKRAVVPPV